MTDQRRFYNAELIHHAADHCREIAHRKFASLIARIAKTEKVYGIQAKIAAKNFNGIALHSPRVHPAMQQHDRTTATIGLIVNNTLFSDESCQEVRSGRRLAGLLHLLKDRVEEFKKNVLHAFFVVGDAW